MNLLQALPGYGQGYGIRTNYATLLPPGGRVAAFLGPQSDAIDQYAASNLLVPTLEAAAGRCRSGAGDTIIVLPNYAETFTGDALASVLPGTRIIGVGTVGGASSPTITLSGVSAGLVFDTADVVFQGMTVLSSAVLTGGVVVSAGGVNIVGNCFRSTGVLAANVLFQIGAAPNLVFGYNYVSANSTATVLNVSSASATDIIINGNFMRQIQGTSGGALITVANVAASGMICDNRGKTATTAGDGAAMVVIGAAAATLMGNCENYMDDEAVSGGILATGA